MKVTKYNQLLTFLKNAEKLNSKLLQNFSVILYGGEQASAMEFWRISLCKGRGT